jgi:hypothetical protein
MEGPELLFRFIAVAHGIAGLVLWAFASDEDFQQFCFYKDRNPLAGDFYKYLAYFACWALMACAYSAFYLPKLAVVLAWLSLIFYLLTGLVDLIAEGRWPSFCKACAVSFAARLVAAGALTGVMYAGLHA